jgi:hypothetical protein
MKKYHITYYLLRESESGPLLGGATIEAKNIVFAINEAILFLKIKESEIKYVIEL